MKDLTKHKKDMDRWKRRMAIKNFVNTFGTQVNNASIIILVMSMIYGSCLTLAQFFSAFVFCVKNIGSATGIFAVLYGLGASFLIIPIILIPYGMFQAATRAH